MGVIAVGKRDGRWFVDVQGCCGIGRYRRDYERAHAVQLLQDGGRLTAWDATGFEVTDRRGRQHHYR